MSATTAAHESCWEVYMPWLVWWTSYDSMFDHFQMWRSGTNKPETVGPKGQRIGNRADSKQLIFDSWHLWGARLWWRKFGRSMSKASGRSCVQRGAAKFWINFCEGGTGRDKSHQFSSSIIVFVPVPAERSPGKSPEQDNMDFLMQESCSNKSLLYYRDMLRMFMAGSPFEVMQHASMYPSLEQGRLSRHEQQCCQGFDFVVWQLYCDRSESSPPDQGFATNQGSLAAVSLVSAQYCRS